VPDFHEFEYPPPRSWDQFEELCADLFEAAWNDPALIRHGRAGQKQNGVDIVARQSGLYPIGLQCKKKARWPAKKLTTGEIDDEVKEAKDFNPPLIAFYILTTAADDIKLQKHVRSINERHKTAGLFQVVLLGWSEIVRRATRYEQVAKKHFTGYGSASLVSPLLATWYTTAGKLELSAQEWRLSVMEVAEDFFDWPNGHIVVRQREADAIVQNLHELIGSKVSTVLRKKRVAMRQDLRRLVLKERYVQKITKMIFTNERLRFYFLELWKDDGDLPVVVREVIEHELDPSHRSQGDHKIRLHPPSPHLLSGYRSPHSVADSDIPIYLSQGAYADIETIKQRRCEQFGKALTGTVDELPHSARAKYALPAILRRIERIQQEERKTVLEIEAAGYLDFWAWKVTY